jgi:hypothetical protein
VILSNTARKAIQRYCIIQGNDLFDAKFELITGAIQRRLARQNSEIRFIKTIN